MFISSSEFNISSDSDIISELESDSDIISESLIIFASSTTISKDDLVGKCFEIRFIELLSLLI